MFFPLLIHNVSMSPTGYQSETAMFDFFFINSIFVKPVGDLFHMKKHR